MKGTVCPLTNKEGLHFASLIVKPVRRACARGWKFGQNASRQDARRAKYSFVGLTTSLVAGRRLKKVALGTPNQSPSRAGTPGPANTAGRVPLARRCLACRAQCGLVSRCDPRAATLRVAGAPEGCRFAAAGPNKRGPLGVLPNKVPQALLLHNTFLFT